MVNLGDFRMIWWVGLLTLLFANTKAILMLNGLLPMAHPSWWAFHVPGTVILIRALTSTRHFA